MISQQFHVLLVAEDRVLLRRLTRFLRTFGCEVSQITEIDQLERAVAAHLPDFVLLDADICGSSLAQVCRLILTARDDIYIFAVTPQRDSAFLSDALQAGVDDFLAKPVVLGELLARLRAGARVLSFQRRWHQQDTVDTRTGLPTRTEVVRFLREKLQHTSGRPPRVSLVSWDVDFFQEVVRRHGAIAAERLRGEVISRMGKLARDCPLLAYLGDDQFLAPLSDVSESEGVAWAERLRKAFAESSLEVEGHEFQLTASFGVASSDGAALDAAQLVDHALHAQQAAKSSGRNCVVRYSQLRADESWWNALAAPGKLFEGTRAADVMIHTDIVLNSDDSVHQAQRLFQQTDLELIPVVDDHGCLVGCVTPTDLVAARPTSPIQEIVRHDMPQLDEEALFAQVMDFFATDPGPVCVVQNQRPIGLLTRQCLTALSRPLDQSDFAPALTDDATSNYLLI